METIFREYVNKAIALEESNSDDGRYVILAREISEEELLTTNERILALHSVFQNYAAQIKRATRQQSKNDFFKLVEANFTI